MHTLQRPYNPIMVRVHPRISHNVPDTCTAACPTFNATTCGPALQCVLMSNKTITVPKSDYCCPITTTTTVGGACKSCQRGCATSTRTFYVTEGSASATTSSASVTYKNHEATTSCTSTLLTAMPFELGPTSTAHPSTVRRTSTLDCGGCGSVIVMDIDGLGPEARFLTTVTASSAKTIAAYVCSATPA